jgi:polygalacturonase
MPAVMLQRQAWPRCATPALLGMANLAVLLTTRTTACAGALPFFPREVQLPAVTAYTETRIYHSSQTPGYTSWVGLWSLPNGTIQTNFIEAKGCCAQNATISFPLLTFHGGWNWTVATAPVGYSRGMAILQDKRSMVRAALSSGADKVHFGPAGHFADPHNNFVGVQFSQDLGLTWSPPTPIVDNPSQWQNCLPLKFHGLRDGRVVAMAGMTLANVSAVMALANMQKFMFVGALSHAGLSWSEPIPLMTIEDGVCEESDFVELPSGDLYFMHRVQHYDSKGKYVSQDYRQSLVLRQGTKFAPQPPTKPPFANQGFPCELLTRDGKVLLDLNLFGSHYSLDYGASWHDLMLPSGKQVRTHYYPQAAQATDGTIVITSHDKGDDEYRSFDESIWMQSFRIHVNELTREVRVDGNPRMIGNHMQLAESHDSGSGSGLRDVMMGAPAAAVAASVSAASSSSASPATIAAHISSRRRGSSSAPAQPLAAAIEPPLALATVTQGLPKSGDDEPDIASWQLSSAVSYIDSATTAAGNAAAAGARDPAHTPVLGAVTSMAGSPAVTGSSGVLCDARKSFGAKGDGVAVDTLAIQRAIATCSSQYRDGAPRSKVLLTNGTFLSGPLRLMSNVELFLGTGSTLLGTDDIVSWPWCKQCPGGHYWPCKYNSSDVVVVDFPCVDTSAVPFITALNAVNIAITGESTGAWGSLPRPDSGGNPAPGVPVIDGRGSTWMQANFDRRTANKTLHDLLHDHRPHVIQFVNCSDVALSGFFIHDSPMYHISFYRGSRYRINNLVLWSPAAATSSIGYWNTDGIDIGAEYVHVKNVFIHNGDDSIIVKGRYPEELPRSSVCFGGRHVLVENCTAIGGLGMGLGTGSLTAVNVTYRNILIGNTSGGSSGGPGIHIKSHETSQSGSAKDVLFERIHMHSVGKAIDISNRNQDLDKTHEAKSHGRSHSRVNSYENVTFRDIRVDSASYAYHFDCVSEAPCTNFHFSNVSVQWTDKPWDQCTNVSGQWNRANVSPSMKGCVSTTESASLSIIAAQAKVLTNQGHQTTTNHYV